MKKLALVFIQIFLALTMYANVPGNIYYFNKDCISIKNVYNEKNKVIAKQEYSVKDIDLTSDNKRAVGSITTFKNGEISEITSSTFLFDTNRLMISMGMSNTGKHVFIDYPLCEAKNQKIISSAEFETNVKVIGRNVKVKCKIRNRMITSFEDKVFTPIGMWKCTKYEYDMKIRNGIVSFNVHVIEWFSSDIGIVRTNIYKGNKLYERRELSKIISKTTKKN